MIQNSKLKNRNCLGGYALLFAMFVSSVLLSAGLGISGIIYKELILSTIGRESQYSFYNAQTALECAFYLNSHGGISSSSMCDGMLIDHFIPDISDGDGLTTSFNVYIKPTQTSTTRQCSSIKVHTSTSPSAYMTIEARGYNTVNCPNEDVAGTNNSRRVERALKLRVNTVP